MGLPHEDYKLLETEYAAIPVADFIKPLGSQEMIVPYAKNLDLIVQRNISALVDEGLDSQIPPRFPMLINGYDVAASLSGAAISVNSIAQNLAVCKEDSETVRTNLLEYSDKAFAGNAALMDQLVAIRRGRSTQNLSQDLMDLNILIGQHREKFAPYKKFDPLWIDQAADLHIRLDALLALKNNPEKTTDLLKLRERQAMTLLFRAIEKIREYGELAFRHDKELLQQLKYSWLSK